MSCTAQSAADASACIRSCLPLGRSLPTLIAIYCAEINDMAVNCDPAALAEASKCFECIPPGDQMGVLIYLSTVRAGVAPDPAALVEAAKCLECIPPGAQLAALLAVECQIANL